MGVAHPELAKKLMEEVDKLLASNLEKGQLDKVSKLALIAIAVNGIDTYSQQ